ncbi:ABC transporter C family member 3-like [Silene latifolia]|uniref:ABC transporter C family member 3-like n=1 Tax=Silene latifolia TaxID=37657 RepID=UPI003D775C72
MYALAQYVCPYLIDAFVNCLNGEVEFKNHGYTLAFIFSVSTLLEGFIYRHLHFKLQQIGMRHRAAASAMIFYKSLTLSSQSKQGQGSGELINLVGVDVKNIDRFARFIHNPWLIILQVLLGLLLLFKNLGLASFVALGATVSVLVFNSVIGKFQEKYQVNLMESRDNRTKMTTETLKNMRILKLHGWEMSFLSKIFQLRNVEALWLRKYLYSSVVMNFVFEIATTFVALVTFGSCIFIEIPLETGKILSSLATFRVLQQPIYMLPQTISVMIQAKVSFGRIASFLSRDEVRVESLMNIAIEIVDGEFSWDMFSPTPTLKNVNLKVHHGMKVAICGRVGSGKSSLLSTILGEMPKISGLVKLCGMKAYVSQTPWIQSGTIQDNILLGKEIDLVRYDCVIEACCLKMDLEILAFGDQTVIGERGINNLSGGQKQRIQIARALYHDADIYLFDDPFSAVDAHTGTHLYKEILLGLLRRKTVVYVTHQLEFLNGADLILVMKDGRIVQQGNYSDIFISGSDFAELVAADNAALSRLDSSIDNLTPVEGGDSNNTNIIEKRETDEDTGLPPTQIIQDEEREKGSVEISVYWKYITTAFAGRLALLTLFGLILCEVLQIGSNFWLAWATPMSKDIEPPVSGSTLMIVYVSLGAGVSLSTLVANMLGATIGYTTGTLFFRKMHECIFRAPMSFFDATPSGRILNRCSEDQSSLENQIPTHIQVVVTAIIILVGILAVMAAVAWQVLIISIPVVFVCIWYQRYYIPSARELARLSGVCAAPVVQYFSEAISGAITIRSFDLQSRFQATYMKILDTYSAPQFCNAAAMKWLMLRLDAFSSLIFASLLVLLVFFSEQIDPAMAGIAVTYGLTLNNTFSGLIWSLCNCETNMISVERILQYMSIPSEAPLLIESNRPDHSWPSCGEISINNLQVRYAPYLPIVLHGITCTFPKRMKTGIVGRTGSGKSTLIQTLFRIVEPTTGRILIDGIDISRIGIQDLRSRLGIIPQDPIMFQGTIRSNLDPLELYTDEQIWETLDKCQLGDKIRKTEKKLDSEVVENGENWSMGERQLVCLGRILVKKSKVLVLDEATASVDTNTDHLIQQTLKGNFSECTIITIAHRMSSVLDSDMILVLNNGHVQEFDSRRKLLENKSSSFAKLVAAWSTSHSNKPDDE